MGGNYSEMVVNLELYVDVSKRLKKMSPDNENYQYEYAASILNLGISHFGQNDYSQALEQFKKSKSEFEKLVPSTPYNNEYEYGYAENLGWISRTLQRVNRIDEARIFRLEEGRQCEKILSSSKDTNWQALYLYAASNRSLAVIDYRNSDLKNAKKFANTAAGLFEQLTSHDLSLIHI